MVNKIYSMIGIANRAGYLKVGETACVNAIKKNKAKIVLIADDASFNTKKKFVNMCNSKNIAFKIFGKKDEIGYSIGKSSISILAVCNNEFLNGFLKLFDGVSPENN
ncbi:L7Ae/L30e/S12e/Gadd45 family ribosomal protein [Clostridiisalibacter paucivorans]|uniref:L7Ae/L30e/S12e/Gadd45 family ribosomal protein n=1 Tax=Clostridiisalibacter paucivorans TaxID=408753 RepID=UPI00047BB660|nr:ribosomal L7Ae/L30e/S12e/Gadd45 family protein [Clostridiisalibacter paucivorans]